MLSFLIEFEAYAIDFGLEVLDTVLEFRNGQRRQIFADGGTPARLLCGHQIIEIHDILHADQ